MAPLSHRSSVAEKTNMAEQASSSAQLIPPSVTAHGQPRAANCAAFTNPRKALPTDTHRIQVVEHPGDLKHRGINRNHVWFWMLKTCKVLKWLENTVNMNVWRWPRHASQRVLTCAPNAAAEIKISRWDKKVPSHTYPSLLLRVFVACESRDSVFSKVDLITWIPLP